MNLTRFTLLAASCAALLACGGNKNAAPATDPAPAPAPAAAPAPAPETKVSLDSTVDRYSYALGTTFIDLVAECEKLGDYVVNVVEARLGIS